MITWPRRCSTRFWWSWCSWFLSWWWPSATPWLSWNCTAPQLQGKSWHNIVHAQHKSRMCWSCWWWWWSYLWSAGHPSRCSWPWGCSTPRTRWSTLYSKSNVHDRYHSCLAGLLRASSGSRSLPTLTPWSTLSSMSLSIKTSGAASWRLSDAKKTSQNEK